MDRLDAETAESCTRLLIHDGPHVIKGAAKGAVKAFNPVNLAHGACVMAKQTSAAAGFILLQAARLETAQELACTQPEQAQVILEQYNAANAAVVEGAIQIGHEFAAHMSTMSREERIEFIAETLAEVALTKSSTKFWLAATGKALNAAGKGVRKIAQVVEEVNPAKPKAIATTPEGLWDMPIGGKKIRGRRYTTHALERMAPDTPQVRAKLEARAIRKGFSKSSKEFEKYVQPHNIPPCVVENVIQCGTCDVNGIRGTLTYILDGVKVVTNIAGDVITVHVC